MTKVSKKRYLQCFGLVVIALAIVRVSFPQITGKNVGKSDTVAIQNKDEIAENRDSIELVSDVVVHIVGTEEVRQLGVEVLRIEAFAEPMFGAAIICYGVFVGAAKTVAPSVMNLISMWGVRITLAALLAPSMGLKGVWLAMCLELTFRGVIFLVKLKLWKR